MTESGTPPFGWSLDLIGGNVPGFLRQIADDIEHSRPGLANGIGRPGEQPVVYRLVSGRFERDHELTHNTSDDNKLSVFLVTGVDVVLRLRFEP